MYSPLKISLLATVFLIGCATDAPSTDDSDFGMDIDSDSDSDSDAGSDSSVLAPEVNINSPSNGDVFTAGETISFIAGVSDDNDDPSLVQIAWISDRDGEVGDDYAESGVAMLDISDLSLGTHTVTIEATDTDGNFSESSVTIRIEEADANPDSDSDSDSNPDSDTDSDFDWDDLDGDGWTSEDGDCDDWDFTVYPGAEELCDGIDNNCDGDIDTEFWDEYEPNELLTTAYEVGELDEDGWWPTGTSSVRLEGLNFDNEYDRDWFTWQADDAWYDDPDIAVHVEGGPLSYFIVEVWLEEWDASHPIASAQGWETVSISEDDFPFDDGWFWVSDWDTWYVSVRTDPTIWDAMDCDTDTYSVIIES
jgi:hypothetical protein